MLRDPAILGAYVDGSILAIRFYKVPLASTGFCEVLGFETSQNRAEPDEP